MKNPYLIPFAALFLFAATGCDKQSPDAAKKIADLEQKNHEAADRQRELEQEIEDQKLAAERDAVERERVRIEDDRAELERQQGAVAAEQDQAIREREEALANREGKLEQFQSALEEKEDDLHHQTQQLSERDSELAGREALSVEQPAQSEPVADYGMFYDSLSSYGSWFETADYGYVWQPVVVSDSNWRPYCRGRWACSDRGWTWVSEEPFGWATYHYGRWTLLRGRGWIWVPGVDWAPCWVSWRESNSHIGWAPLPPETMAYRGHNWDSSVDVQFGIGALCYNFVEMRYFGSSLYTHCLPLSGNDGCFQQTANTTYIHIENRQVICGGPKYKKVCEGVGRPLPFYRLEIDQHPRPSRDSLAMRPRIKGDHLVVSAPNMDVAWNDGLKPKRIKDRIETVTVERPANLGREITDRYRQTREEGRQKAETAIVELGGTDQFEQRRDEKLQDNRRVQESKGRKEESRDVVKNSERTQRDNSPGTPVMDPMPQPADPAKDQAPDRVVRQADQNRPRPEVVDDRRNPIVRDTPRVTPTEAVKPRPEPRPQQPADDRRVARNNDSAKQVETQREPQRPADPAVQARKEVADRRQDEQVQTQRQAKQNEADQARQAQQDAIKRQQAEQAQQRQLEKQQQQAEQAREAQQEAIRQQRDQDRMQRQQREIAQQREQERTQRQQQEDQQREMQRQQDRAQQQQQEARQQQQEQARQRQQEENQRQQENARQRQQEENQRQRQQEESRQKQEKDQKDQDDQRKRGR